MSFLARRLQDHGLSGVRKDLSVDMPICDPIQEHSKTLRTPRMPIRMSSPLVSCRFGLDL